MTDPADLRRDYERGQLDDKTIGDDPFVVFSLWFNDAVAGDLVEPNAMTLATVDGLGRPSARIVLLKGFDRDGFRWYTNYESNKSRDIANNPYASLLFWFDRLERQVRIEGTAEQLPTETSDAYFASRPRGSQIGAWASPQSQPVSSREALDDLERAATERFGDDPVPRPPHWGGFRLRPRAFEFWQGRRSRLHDRFRFELDGERWARLRLAP